MLFIFTLIFSSFFYTFLAPTEYALPALMVAGFIVGVVVFGEENHWRKATYFMAQILSGYLASVMVISYLIFDRILVTRLEVMDVFLLLVVVPVVACLVGVGLRGGIQIIRNRKFVKEQ